MKTIFVVVNQHILKKRDKKNTGLLRYVITGSHKRSVITIHVFLVHLKKLMRFRKFDFLFLIFFNLTISSCLI
ncbi:hypothetical protein BpHYR1_011911 [Brachionus plicatilis]|uniref:Uncharacterized protein n=1 Tax=Brachionus plicatilis TaxID=10195 RepID=A0A3M7RH89_BRAPC|nr:hypothetical protein BpHYR1_011911 [Brachionus plicatilis]